MSDCGMVRSLLLSWVDEKLPDDLKGQVAEHLAASIDCDSIFLMIPEPLQCGHFRYVAV